MTETANAHATKAVVGELHPPLEGAGFRMQRHRFNRETEPTTGTAARTPSRGG